MQQLPFQQLVKASAVLFGLSLMALLWNYSPKINASNFKLLKAGFEPEFVGRADGYPRLREVYGLELEIKTLNATLMYKAVKEKEVDVISGYSTDGRVQAFDLKVLKDDKNAFPPYQAAFLIREESLLKWPKLAALLGALEGILSDSLMTALNYQADFLKHPPDSVAQGFVQQLNLELPDLAGQASGEVLRVGSKIFTEQYILVEILRLLVEQHTLLTLDAKTGLGGTKICFDALLAGEIDLYPEYTGTGLQVMLQPSSDTLSQLIRDERATFHYVEREFKGRYNLVWMPPLGFNNSYALMMRKEQTESLDVHSISDLTQLFNLDK